MRVPSSLITNLCCILSNKSQDIVAGGIGQQTTRDETRRDEREKKESMVKNAPNVQSGG